MAAVNCNTIKEKAKKNSINIDFKINVCYNALGWKLIGTLLILITFFIGLLCTIYICSKNKCIFTYVSKKEK